MADRRQKAIKKIEKEGSDVMCNASLPLQSGDCGTDRETTTDAAGLQEQLGKENYGSEEGR